MEQALHSQSLGSLQIGELLQGLGVPQHRIWLIGQAQ